MAAVSAPQAANALTPPSSSHGAQSSWDYSVPAQNQHLKQTSKISPETGYQHSTDRGNVAAQSSGTLPQSSRPEFSHRRADTFNSSHSSKSNQTAEAAYLAPARVSALIRKDSNISDSGSAGDSLLDLYGSNSANQSGMNSMDLGDRKDLNEDEDPERSRWIHRDKLARIESEELQAAGILLPRPRAQSKSSRRERSRDQQSNGHGISEQSGQHQKRQRIESFPAEEADEQQDISWDLRLPEEVAQDENSGNKEHGGSLKGMSRIPVFKTSPLPIPIDYLERDKMTPRTRTNGWTGDDEGISYPKSRTRGDSIKQAEDSTATPTPLRKVQPDTSPSKKVVMPAARKGSIPSIRTASAQARPKTRAGPKDTPTPNSRPPTRSGETGPGSSVKKPEGDPPWLASMYKPDPRLPPDQQLLPTVAKRLQQEQWEKEGKFGNTYDKDFRPLNDEELPQPEIVSQTIEVEQQKPEDHSEWPLRTPKSDSLSTTGRPDTGSGYSTMPKIQDVPPSQMSPRVVSTPQPTPLRIEEPPPATEEPKQKEGCGCCIVM